jgi:phage terminase small subunit
MTEEHILEWPEPPEHLSKRSQALWLELVGENVKSPQKLTLFQTALEALDRADEAKALVDSEGLTFKTKTTGAVQVHPAVKVEKDSRALFARLWTQLSLTYDPHNWR